MYHNASLTAESSPKKINISILNVYFVFCDVRDRNYSHPPHLIDKLYKYIYFEYLFNPYPNPFTAMRPAPNKKAHIVYYIDYIRRYVINIDNNYIVYYLII